ncbi:ABC transporter substrate-binding protein [Roseibium aquae]|uniref:ABC transporter substrate-binding protein n=1 Tax=Roseibium aquae TaxID=1323746 RepID=A0A916TP37_9HYPH|nr:C4-dicarboxylate TRAP transporter substrate-binding protein [Roseibium aquae]GGB55987.1 ABC transporter substrate-binding protein [Roseibium aquae]
MSKHKSVIAAVAAVVTGLGVAAPATAQDYTLRFNHVLGPSEPYHQGFTQWAERVAERSDGRLKIDVFHSAQLGVEEDIIEQMRQGANVGQNTDAARLGNYVPSIAVVNGPYFAESLEDVAKLADTPSMQAWQEELAKDHGLKVVCFDWVQGYRHFFTNTPITAPDDLDGLRIRTPPAPIWQESISALGAAPTAMAFGDMYPGLQQRAIDGVELVYNNIPAGRFYEVLSHVSETGHIMLVNFQVVSNAWFEGLPEDLQAILVEECKTAGQETSAAILESEQKVKADLVAKGMTVVEGVDMAAFRAAGENAYEALNLGDARRQVLSEMGKE